MIDSVSTPGWPRGPRTSVMTPSPRSSGDGKAQHLEDDLVVRLRPLGAGIADVDAVAEDGAIDADVALAVALEVGADELARGPFEDLQTISPRGPESGRLGLRVMRTRTSSPVAASSASSSRMKISGPAVPVDGDAAGRSRSRRSVVRKMPVTRAVRLGGADGVVLAELDAALLDQVAQQPCGSRRTALAGTPSLRASALGLSG